MLRQASSDAKLRRSLFQNFINGRFNRLCSVFIGHYVVFVVGESSTSGRKAYAHEVKEEIDDTIFTNSDNNN